MRIGLLCDEYPPLPHGGIGTFMRTYAHGLVAGGHDVTVLGSADADCERDDGGVRVIGLGRTRFRGAAWWRDRLRFRKAIDCGRFDVVEVPDYGGLLPRGAGSTPVVMRIFGSATLCSTWAKTPGAPLAARRVRWCERRTAAAAAAWTHPTRHALQGTLRVLIGDGARRPQSTFVPYPVPDVPANAGGEPDGLPDGDVVLFVGSLWGLRGVTPAAHALRNVLRARPDAHAVFVGEDAIVDGRPSHAVIHDIIGEASASRVHLAGRVPPAEVTRWMRSAHVMLHPGEREAFGLAVLEAMREGLPVVAASRGASPEILRDDVTGLLVDPDRPEALAAAVERVLDDDALATRLRGAARDDLRDRLSVATCVRSSVAIYESVIATRGGSGS